MTTPSNPPDYPGEGPAPTDPEGRAGSVAPPDPVEPESQPPQEVPPPRPYAPDPFAPVYRAPKVPWVNPARRGHVAAALIVGALLFGGGGLLIGHAAWGDGEHGGRRGGIGHHEHGAGMQGRQFGPEHHPRMQDGPARPFPRRPEAPSAVPTPSGSRTR